MPNTPYIVGAPESESSATWMHYIHDCDNPAGITTSAGTVSYSAGEAGHPGIITLLSATAQYSQSRFNWGQNVQVLPFWLDYFQKVSWVVKYDSVSSTQAWFGIYGTTGGPTSDQNQNYSILAFLNGSTLTFNVNTTTTSNATTSVTISANTWYKFDIVRNSATSVSLYVNDTLAATITTGVPSGVACGVGGRLMTLANPGAKTMYMDLLEMTFTPTAARY